MIRSTQIARLDGLMLCASVDDEATESALAEIKSQVKLVLRRLNRNSEPQASIESSGNGAYTLHYQIADDIVYVCICDRSYPRKLAFTYLADLAAEFKNTHPPAQVNNPTLRPYAFMDFDTFIARTKATYSDARASQNLDKLNDELRDVTNVMKTGRRLRIVSRTCLQSLPRRHFTFTSHRNDPASMVCDITAG